MPKALIAGSAGQDGIYLSRLLRAKGYRVEGIGHGGRYGEVDHGYEADLPDRDSIRAIIGDSRPDEVYCLAAYHQSSESGRIATEELVGKSFDVNVMALNQMLGALADICPAGRLLYAGSSRVFGAPADLVQDEDTPFNPVDPYGIAKAAGIQICRYWRQTRGLFAVSAILYNHESPLRPASFLSQKIVRAAVSLSLGSRVDLQLGNLAAQADWGHASDAVMAMWLMLQQRNPADYVVATGQLHTVSDWLDEAFSAFSLNWHAVVSEHPNLLNSSRPAAVLCGDASRLVREAGWKCAFTFRALVRDMVDQELARQQSVRATANNGL